MRVKRSHGSVRTITANRNQRSVTRGYKKAEHSHREAEADTGPNDEVNIVLLLVQEGLPGPNDEEVKIGNQVVNTGLIYGLKQ